MFEKIVLPDLPGKLSFWVEDLTTGEASSANADLPQEAASVIKLIVMLAAFQGFHDGWLDAERVYTLKNSDKLPPCGVLTFLHEGLRVTVRDLVTLMIIVSDNTATNLLIDLIGIGRIGEITRAYELDGLNLRRKLFDGVSSAKGIQNTVTARGVAAFFRKLHAGELISAEASKEMTDILLGQQLNGKLPFYSFEDVDIAHKTGEDDGVTHDAGIIYAEHPTIAVFLGSETDQAAYNRYIQDMGKILTGI